VSHPARTPGAKKIFISQPGFSVPIFPVFVYQSKQSEKTDSAVSKKARSGTSAIFACQDAKVYTRPLGIHEIPMSACRKPFPVLPLAGADITKGQSCFASTAPSLQLFIRKRHKSCFSLTYCFRSRR
jgi:hypothetical protein